MGRSSLVLENEEESVWFRAERTLMGRHMTLISQPTGWLPVTEGHVARTVWSWHLPSAWLSQGVLHTL